VHVRCVGDVVVYGKMLCSSKNVFVIFDDTICQLRPALFSHPNPHVIPMTPDSALPAHLSNRIWHVLTEYIATHRLHYSKLNMVPRTRCAFNVALLIATPFYTNL